MFSQLCTALLEQHPFLILMFLLRDAQKLGFVMLG